MNWLLTALWLLPLIGAIATVAHRYVAMAAALGTLVLAILVAFQFDAGGAKFQLVIEHSWISAINAQYIVGIDGIALTLVLLTAALVPVLLLATYNEWDCKIYPALILLTEAMVILSFIALDVLLFYVLFEAMLIPLYFLIGGPGAQRSYAAMKFLLYNLFGGLIMLAALVGVYAQAGTFDVRAIDLAGTSPDLLRALFAGFMFAFAVKAPLWPVHTWLPDAAVAAPPPAAVLMMAIVDKVGTFGMIRYCLTLFGDAADTFAPLIMTLAVISIVYGALVAIGQTDILRLIAYTSISHFGFIVLGIFAMSPQSQAGATLYMVNHGISTAALFLVAAVLVRRTGLRTIPDFGGVAKVAPKLAGVFLIAGLATLALPGLAPFISEFLVLVGTYRTHPLPAIAATAALVLSAIYILWLYQRVFGGPPTGPEVKDLHLREVAFLAPLIAALVVLGVYPKPALDVITPAVPVHTAEAGTP
ncbi:MAG: NADH-quinone oxidoreductase subunit M [Nocardiaceae bacterium]|nr:NADH-quinone oxidoreductase subunit M [Nocardiaceae bacterium]